MVYIARLGVAKIGERKRKNRIFQKNGSLVASETIKSMKKSKNIILFQAGRTFNI